MIPKNLFYILMALFFAMPGLACDGDIGINKDLYVEDGETQRGDLTSVNGSITIGENSEVRGTCNTVNGRIRVGEKARVEGLNTVNGTIDVRRNVIVEDEIASVNGDISTSEGCEIRSDVASVNGTIELIGTEVSDDVTTINGNVYLRGGTIVAGNVVVKRVTGNRGNQHVKIVLEDGSKVRGDIDVRDRDVRVTVYLRDGSEVAGEIINARVERD